MSRVIMIYQLLPLPTIWHLSMTYIFTSDNGWYLPIRIFVCGNKAGIRRHLVLCPDLQYTHILPLFKNKTKKPHQFDHADLNHSVSAVCPVLQNSWSAFLRCQVFRMTQDRPDADTAMHRRRLKLFVSFPISAHLIPSQNYTSITF